MQKINLKKRELLELINKIFKEDDSISIEFKNDYSSNYIFTPSQIEPKAKIEQCDDILEIRVSGGFKYLDK